MAVRLEIDNADGLGKKDYTRYLAAPAQAAVTLRDRMNEPSLLDFTLYPADEGFTQPRRSAMVRMLGLAGSPLAGEARIAAPIFTGFLTSDPSLEFSGVRNGAPVYAYRCQATSEDYLLNIKRTGHIPPFLNRSAGEVLRQLTEMLQPGRFDLSDISEGAFLPHYEVAPGTTWTEVARDLAERSGCSYQILDGSIRFARISQLPVGVPILQADPRFRPDALEIQPESNPIHNDVTVFGEAEPQAYVQEYFVGDGFTSRFLLAAPVFGAESERLLADDFTSPAIDASRWIENDPEDFLTAFEGRLNLTGGTGVLGGTTLRAREVLELAGEIEIIHGEFEFTGASSGILGGIYSDAQLGQEECLVGFEAAPFQSTTRLRPVISGIIQPTEVIVAPENHYILTTRLSASQPRRILQTFTSLDEIFGGNALPADIRVTLVVREINPEAGAEAESAILYDSVLTELPAFAFYAPVNSSDLHLVMNFLQLTRPIQALLETEIPGESVRLRTLGFGIGEHDATITSDPNQKQWALEFYEDTIPARSEKISLRYRAAGKACARLRSGFSILAEAALAGDNGGRAAVLSDLNPAPRSSTEAELAALAYLADHLLPSFEGRYSTWNEFVDAFPRSGTVLEVHNPERAPEFAAIVRSVTSEFRELETEKIFHSIEFGQPSRFEDILFRFSENEAVLKPDLPALSPSDADQAGNAYLEDLPTARLLNTSQLNFALRMGSAPPPGGEYEIRRTDQGWGSSFQPGTSQNLVQTTAQDEFLIQRTSRRQKLFIRAVDENGRTSRHSAILSIQFPLPPPTPESLSLQFGNDASGKPVIVTTIRLGNSGLADVDRVELRDSDNETVLAEWTFGQLRYEDGVYRAEYVLNNSEALLRSKTLFAYTQNALGERSSPAEATAQMQIPAKPFLTTGNSVGQILEIGLDRLSDGILKTQIQIAGPGGSFDSPEQDVTVDSQPEKFSFVATSSGGWAFRARRSDALGWSPWSNEPQGQLSAQTLVFLVQFFQARELDPSIGAAINGQNLLPNSDFFLGGIAGQEGTHAPRYFKLANALADGSEVDYLGGTNEVQWKSGISLAAANPGIRTLLSNLGKTLNPGEPVTLTAAFRHSGTLTFGLPIRLALRSPSQPEYDCTAEIPTGKIISTYLWFSATFALPSAEVVPSDLSVEIGPVISSGNSLATSLFCDKVILNRGHRPCAFNLAPWDVIALDWSSAMQSYSLPATAVAEIPRSTDPGSAGTLVGTGTDDADVGFASRFFRVVA